MILFFTWPVYPGLADAPPDRDFTGRIQRVVQEYVEQHLEAGEILVDCSPYGRVEGMEGTTEIRVVPASKGLRAGSRIIRCGFFEDGRLLRAFNVRAEIRTYEKVVVSNRSLPFQAVVAREDLSLEKRETTALSQKCYTSLQEVVGLRTKRIVQAGETLCENTLEPQPLIPRGQKVAMHFMKGTLEIELPGRAREDGLLGETIRVRCLETRKCFEARVIDANTVVVNLL